MLGVRKAKGMRLFPLRAKAKRPETRDLLGEYVLLVHINVKEIQENIKRKWK